MISEVSTDDPKLNVHDNDAEASPDDNDNNLQCADEGIDVDMCEDLSTHKNEVKLIPSHYLYLLGFFKIKFLIRTIFIHIFRLSVLIQEMI